MPEDSPVMIRDGYVPIIDLGLDRSEHPGRRTAVAAAIGDACASSGFLVVVGHAIPADVITGIRAAAAEFFALPTELKVNVAASPLDPLKRGFVLQTLRHEQFYMNRLGEPRLRTELDNELGDNLLMPNRWPDIPDFRERYLAYHRAVESFAGELMRLFALSLGLPREYFDGRIDRHMSPLTTNYYPAQELAPLPGELRNEQHRDWSAVTILYQDDAPGGLQVLHPSDDWIDVPPVPGSFVINLGRIMAMWTNDRWASTLHRVVNPQRADAHRDRISIGLFLHPNPEILVEPVETCIEPGEPPHHQPVLSGDFFLSRAKRAMSGAAVAS